MELLLATLVSLFSIVDPIGAVPIFMALTPDATPAQRARISLEASLYFLGIMLAFFLAGVYILSFFGISVHAMRIAGGFVMLFSGFSLMSDHTGKAPSYEQDAQEEGRNPRDIAFAPLCMPVLSGPGAISLLITQYMAHPNWTDKGWILIAIVACAALVFLTLRLGPNLFRFFGKGGLTAITRIMGFLVIAIGVEFTVSGIVGLVDSLH